MKLRIVFILNVLLMMTGSAYGQFNPDNPEEPGVPVFYYHIDTSCSTENIAYTSGSGDYSPGSQVWIHTSLYSSQYTFSHWSWTIEGKEYTSKEKGFYYTMTDIPVSFVAHYSFTPNSPEEPSTVLKAHLYLTSEPKGIATFNRTSGERLEVGCGHYIEAYSNQGYEFQGWYLNHQRISTDPNFYYTMPDKNTELVARYVYKPINPPDPDDQGNLDYTEDDIPGDVNGDGEVDLSDLKYLVKIISGQQDEIDAADVNRDNHFSVADITQLIKILREKNNK